MLSIVVGCPCFPAIPKGPRVVQAAPLAGLRAEPAEKPAEKPAEEPAEEPPEKPAEKDAVPSPDAQPAPPAPDLKKWGREQSAGSSPADREQSMGSSPDDWRGVALLSLAWACTFATMTASVAVLSLAGRPFSPGAGADTVPLGCLFYSSGLANVFIPYEIHRFGRRHAYFLGAALGVAGSITCSLAVLWESFFVLCLGGSLLGMSIAHAQNYRFAAILLAHSNPPKAVSWVTAGGVLGAVLGPGVLARAKHLFPHDFAGVYVLSMAMFVLALMLLYGVNFPGAASAAAAAGKPIATGSASESRRLAVIFAQPRCWAATVAGLSAYVGMLFIMAPTPIVMRGSFGHSYDEATLVMMVHMVLMFAPSPGTARFICWAGPATAMLAGCAAIFLAATVLFVGTSLLCFFVGLGCLGVGWNFLFLAGTTQLASTYRPAEGPKVQALSDGITFMASGTASLVSAPIIDSIGWEFMQVIVMMFMAVVAAAVALPPVLESCNRAGAKGAARGSA